MLLRALLAAAAFSCTLSIARDQSTQHLTQIKDLICVLILSGMQKEDLEVSMLRKLQRYNVNIDDMNNENLRKECTLRNGDLSGVKIYKTDESFVSATENISTVAIEDPVKGFNVEEVLYHLKVRPDSLINQTEKYSQKQQVSSTSEFFKGQSNAGLSFIRSYIQLETTEKSINKQNRQGDITVNLNHEYDFNIEKVNRNASKDIAFINNVFKDYFIKKQTQFTATISTTTRRTIDLENIYKTIDELMANATNKEKEMSESRNRLAENNARNNILNAKDTIHQQQSNYDMRAIYDFLDMPNQFKTYFSLGSTQKSTSLLPFHKNHEATLPETIRPRNIIEYEEFIKNKPEPIIDVKQKILPPKFVQEIAESVKDVIIKDLRKELSNIYFKPSTITTSTTTTTGTPTTTTLKLFSKEKAIMDSFMELYEKIKALNQPTLVLDAHNKTKNVIHVSKQETKGPPIQPPYIIMNRLGFPETKAIPAVDTYNTMQERNVNKYYLPMLKYNQVPITIQTNSVEIKPLAVPLTKPETLIRQNIIVKPKHRFQDRSDSHQYLKRPFNPSKGSEIKNLHRSNLIKLYQEYNVASNPIHYSYHNPKHNNEDVVRFRMRNSGDSKFDTHYYEKMHLGNLNVGNDEKNKKFESRNNVIQRFHERLERVDDKMPALTGTYNLNNDDKNRPNTHKYHVERQDLIDGNVNSRQQLSLIDMKKGSSYGDTHFKNFLKTQQKVTDILERILASGPKNNQPRSVEIT